MFKLFKQKQEIPQQNILDKLGLFLVQDATSFLKETTCQTALQELKQLVSTTQSNYQTLYLELFYKFAEFVQSLPDKQNVAYDHPGGLLEHALMRTIAALKCRRGYMLPVGADTETCYKQQEVWTYAVFTAALLKDVWQVVTFFKITVFDPEKNEQHIWHPLCDFTLPKEKYYRCSLNYSYELSQSILNSLVVKQLLPDAGFRWIHQYDALFQYWLNYLSDHIVSQNTIAEIIQKAEVSINPVPDKKQILNSKLSEDNKKPATEEKHEATSTSNERGQDIVDAFLFWIKQGIKNGVFAINTNDSFLHRTAEGLFVAMPKALESFFKENHQYTNLFQNSDKNCLLFFLDKIKSSNSFIKISSDNYLHEFYLGEWKDRYVLQGLLLNTDTIEEDLPTVPINKNLYREQNIY